MISIIKYKYFTCKTRHASGFSQLRSISVNIKAKYACRNSLSYRKESNTVQIASTTIDFYKILQLWQLT